MVVNANGSITATNSCNSSATLLHEGRPLTSTTTTAMSKAERRKKRRATPKYRHLHASRERVRVEAFNSAFAALRAFLPTLPPDRKLSKIEILRLSICYIGYLESLLAL